MNIDLETIYARFRAEADPLQDLYERLSVQSAGTSEGVKKSWAKRKTGGMSADEHESKARHFYALSDMHQAQSLKDVWTDAGVAHSEAARAIRSDTPQGHYKAAVANRQAASSVKLTGQMDLYKKFHEIADSHDNRGEQLDPKGESFKR